MIILRVWGGLGNQLFQYSFAYALSKKNSCEIILDKRFFEKDFLEKNKRFTPQKFHLNLFKLKKIYKKKNYLNKKQISKINFLQKKQINRLIRLFPFFYINIGNDTKYLKETRNKFKLINKNLISKKNIYLDGYWQSSMYFSEFKEELSNIFTKKNNHIDHLLKKIQFKKQNSIAIHIRRGDYSKTNSSFSNLYLLDLEYYNNAIKYYLNKVENPVFYIFSNDFKWAKNSFANIKNIIYVNEEREFSDFDEFQALINFKYFIIANSTFSWWPAYLSKSKDKIVISPKRWFGNKDIIPSNWLKM